MPGSRASGPLATLDRARRSGIASALPAEPQGAPAQPAGGGFLRIRTAVVAAGNPRQFGQHAADLFGAWSPHCVPDGAYRRITGATGDRCARTPAGPPRTPRRGPIRSPARALRTEGAAPDRPPTARSPSGPGQGTVEGGDARARRLRGGILGAGESLQESRRAHEPRPLRPYASRHHEAPSLHCSSGRGRAPLRARRAVEDIRHISIVQRGPPVQGAVRSLPSPCEQG